MSYKKIEDFIAKDFVNDDPIADDNYLFAASANDMTGLTPTVAHNEDEAQNYEEVFPYLPPLTPEIKDEATPTASDGIHAEYRTQVTEQNQSDTME